MHRISLAMFLLLVACGDEEALPEGFESSLAAAASCGDVYLTAANETDTLHLVFRAFDAPLAALAGGAPEVTYDRSAASSEAILFLERGARLSVGFCDGTGSPSVQARYQAVAGTITLTADAQGITMSLAGIELRQENGSDRATIESLTLSYPD